MTTPNQSPTNILLGYPPEARLLIINADDFGMCHSTTQATLQAFQQGVVRSTSLMVPTAWAIYAMQRLAEHPELPFGVHLTAICDGAEYRWRPMTPAEKISTLVDASGHFLRFEHMQNLLARLRLDELELEFRAQIEAVLASGLRPTHLDWHSLRIRDRADIFELMFELARDYGLALRVYGAASVQKVLNRGLPVNDTDFLDSYQLDPQEKSTQFIQLLRQLPPGLNEWAVHPGLGNDELRAIEPGGYQMRQADYDFLISPQAKDIIQEEGIILLDYCPLQQVWTET